MAIGDAGFESRGLTGLEQNLPHILDEHHLAFEDVDELVLAFVPVSLRGLITWLEPRQIDAELIKADHVAEPLALAAGNRLAVGLRVAGRNLNLDVRNIDLRHRSALS